MDRRGVGSREGEALVQPARGQPLHLDRAECSETIPAVGRRRAGPGIQNIPVEAQLDGYDYLVRAELPGVDPDAGLQVTVQRGVLTIRAERSEGEKDDKVISEFRYGSFARRIRLPEGAREGNVRAVYRDGILTVRVGLGQGPASRHHPEALRPARALQEDWSDMTARVVRKARAADGMGRLLSGPTGGREPTCGAACLGKWMGRRLPAAAAGPATQESRSPAAAEAG